MNTQDALKRVADYLGLKPMSLYVAFEQDKHGGAATWRPDGKQWPGMSIKTDEARLLYAVIRVLQPLNVLEFGTYGGCSATHILQALHDNNEGKLLSVDIDPLRQPGVPDDLTDRWTFVKANGITYDFRGYHCDLCLEDTSHTQHSTSNLCRRALRLGAQLVIVHDVTNPTSGQDVRAGVEQVFDEHLIVELGAPSLGFSFCLRRNAKKDFDDIKWEPLAPSPVGETMPTPKDWRE